MSLATAAALSTRHPALPLSANKDACTSRRDPSAQLASWTSDRSERNERQRHVRFLHIPLSFQ